MLTSTLLTTRLRIRHPILLAPMGEAVGLIHDFPKAAEIVDRIVTEAEQTCSDAAISSAPPEARQSPADEEKPCGRTADYSTSSRPNFRSC